MKTTTIFDAEGGVLARIDHHNAGHAILRGANNAVHAYYDAEDDCTRDAFNRILARGDQIERLVPILCARLGRGRRDGIV
jgi:hypothetical protein